MSSESWTEQFAGAITVCDTKGTILHMNDKAVQAFQKYGGKSLLGSNLLDCHPKTARSKLIDMMDTRRTNVYTVEKAGVRKLIYQTPWYQDGAYAGMVELMLEIPNEMPHFDRNG